MDKRMTSSIAPLYPKQKPNVKINSLTREEMKGWMDSKSSGLKGNFLDRKKCRFSISSQDWKYVDLLLYISELVSRDKYPQKAI